jgi:protein SMG9
MAATGGNSSSNSQPSSHQAPKILLAKPALVTAGKFNRTGGGDDDSASLRSRHSPIGSLNLLSDSWDFNTDRFLPFLTDNTDFTVIGVIGLPGAGKSTIMNEIYGFDGSSPGMLPPFAIESEETRSMARHCTVGIEPRISSERIILLDTQPVLSPSVLAEILRPDGSSTISVLNGESLSAELAHELMGIQLGILLTSICHIVLVVSEGVHDINMWRLMLTVDLLKHGIPDPSSLTFSHPQSSNMGSDKEMKEKIQEGGDEYMATPIFIHTKVRQEIISPQNSAQLKKALSKYFGSSSFTRSKPQIKDKENLGSSRNQIEEQNSAEPKLFLVPSKTRDDFTRAEYESYNSSLWKLRDQILMMNGLSFSRTVSERDWLKNSAKIWELVKISSVVGDYCKTLQSSGLFRR